MLMNCKKCKKLSIDYVNSASGLDLHRFNWLENDNEIGALILMDGMSLFVLIIKRFLEMIVLRN